MILIMLLIYNNKVEDRALSCSTSNTPGGSNSLAMIEAKGPVLRDIEGQAIREAKGPVLRAIEGLTPNDSASRSILIMIFILTFSQTF